MVHARLSRDSLLPNHGSTRLTTIVEMAVSRAHPTAIATIMDQGASTRANDTSHLGAASLPVCEQDRYATVPDERCRPGYLCVLVAPDTKNHNSLAQIDRAAFDSEI